MNLTVTSSPHIRGKDNTRKIMRDVIAALLPAVAVSVIIFGIRAFLIELICVVSALLAEWIWCVLTRQGWTPGDGSAAVTGLLLALTLPVSVPYWLASAGSIFAIVVVKGMCGGLGHNMFNPALAARAFMLLIAPVSMIRFVEPRTKMMLFHTADAVSSATSLHEMQRHVIPDVSLWDMFIGNIAGSIGEVSAAALLAGGIYLIVRKVIRPHIPLAYLGSVAVLTLVFHKGEDPILWMLYSLLGSGLILGAVFMATDYATSPVTPKGQIIYGIGAGILTVFFRYTGLFPEGVTYAILWMNAAAWLIDQHTAPRRFGTKKGVRS